MKFCNFDFLSAVSYSTCTASILIQIQIKDKAVVVYHVENLLRLLDPLTLYGHVTGFLQDFDITSGHLQ